MAVKLPTIMPSDLADAEEWGDGWCLACGVREPSLEDGHATHECSECGERAVVAAADLTEIARKLALATG